MAMTQYDESFREMAVGNKSLNATQRKLKKLVKLRNSQQKEGKTSSSFVNQPEEAEMPSTMKQGLKEALKEMIRNKSNSRTPIQTKMHKSGQLDRSNTQKLNSNNLSKMRQSKASNLISSNAAIHTVSSQNIPLKQSKKALKL